MTADAKIGLLLGLVFIFIIAFIINGLPHLWSHPQTAGATQTDKQPAGVLGVVGPAQNVSEKLDWKKLLEDGSGAGTTTPADATGAGSTNPDVAVAQGGGTSGGTVDPVGPSKPAEPVAVEPPLKPAVNPGNLKGDQKKAPAAPAPSKAEKTPPAVNVAKKPSIQEYQVKDGETLATIAKKVYGATEGNKVANVDRIFEFNRGVLKSRDEITAGQKLRIPPLPTTAPNPAKPEDVLPASHFEKVPSIGKPGLTDARSDPTATQGDRLYTVQDGDNLWKIAASQLGNGSRSEEIAKLNAAVLKSPDSLTIGMKLRLPAK